VSSIGSDEAEALEHDDVVLGLGKHCKSAVLLGKRKQAETSSKWRSGLG
jgi:hypothetical protein